MRAKLATPPFLMIDVPLKNISGEIQDYCNFRIEIELVFEHKTFAASQNEKLIGHPLYRINDDKVRAESAREFGEERSNEYQLMFIFDKISLDPEIFKHKPKRILLNMGVAVENSVGYSNHKAGESRDLIFDKLEINGW